MIHTGRRDCSCNKCRPSFDSKSMDKVLIRCSDEFIRFLKWIAFNDEPHMYNCFPKNMDIWNMRERMKHIIDIIEKPYHYTSEYEKFQKCEEPCPDCGNEIIVAEFGTSESDESTVGIMCEKECGYTYEWSI
jgi:ribosomal protein S27AE